MVVDPGVHRWVVADTLVGAAAVAPELDAVQDSGCSRTGASEPVMVVELGLEARKPILGETVDAPSRVRCGPSTG